MDNLVWLKWYVAVIFTIWEYKSNMHLNKLKYINRKDRFIDDVSVYVCNNVLKRHFKLNVILCLCLTANYSIITLILFFCLRICCMQPISLCQVVLFFFCFYFCLKVIETHFSWTFFKKLTKLVNLETNLNNRKHCVILQKVSEFFI